MHGTMDHNANSTAFSYGELIDKDNECIQDSVDDRTQSPSLAHVAHAHQQHAATAATFTTTAEMMPNGTAESEFDATQHLSQLELKQPPLPLPIPLPIVPPPEEHWATLIPDTANPACPRIELKGTREKVKHVIGRRPKYPNARREAVKTDTVLPHTVVSGLHCMIWREWDPDAPGDASLAIAYLEDHSTNGTFVNGEKIKQERIAIGDGDDISLGQIVTGRELASEFRFRFQLECAKSERSQRNNPHDAGGLFLKYDIRGQIGSGSFAKVHRAINKKTGEWNAVKIIDKKRSKLNQKTMFQLLEREITIMKALDNPYIVKFYEGFEDEDTLWLVIEYVSGGDLLDFVIDKGGLSEYEASDVALQVCEAMSYLHQQGVAHRDLKPENILMTKGPQPRCKIADFGLAKLPGTDTFLKTMCGTPTYLAPEVILQGADRPGYSFAVDAWSVGVIIYSCIANASPFQEDESLPLAERMRTRTPDIALLYEMGCSAEAIDFVCRFMVRDPAMRMTVYEATNHPWLAVHRRERVLTKRQSSLTRLPSSQSAGGSQQRRKAAPAGRHLSTVPSSRATPPPPDHPPVDYIAPDSTQAPASNWSSMGTLSRSHTLTDDENSDVVSEAPSYSQRLQRLRIESDFETSQQPLDPVVIQDSQDTGSGASKVSLLAEELSDFTPPAAGKADVDSNIYSQAGIKRKLPTSAFSSDESMQAIPKEESQQSTVSNGHQIGHINALAGQVGSTVKAQVLQAFEPTRIELSNAVIAADYALRDRGISSASSDSSLSPVEESPPKSTPQNGALKAKSINSGGRRSASGTPRTAKAASQGPARRSTRLSVAHTTAANYAESESEDGKPPSSARKAGRARKQRRLSAQPS